MIVLKLKKKSKKPVKHRMISIYSWSREIEKVKY